MTRLRGGAMLLDGNRRRQLTIIGFDNLGE
jgi:hypothetical protein